jgi:hypothetical protein
MSCCLQPRTEPVGPVDYAFDGKTGLDRRPADALQNLQEAWVQSVMETLCYLTEEMCNCRTVTKKLVQ